MQDPSTDSGNSTATLVVLAVALVAVIAFVVLRKADEPVAKGDPVARGQQIYRTICIACHHPDPSKEYGTTGTFGPPIAGSSYELIEKRVLSTNYPEGYKPKRDTRLMTAFDLKADQLRALHAFLNQPAGGPAAGNGADK